MESQVFNQVWMLAFFLFLRLAEEKRPSKKYAQGRRWRKSVRLLGSKGSGISSFYLFWPHPCEHNCLSCSSNSNRTSARYDRRSYPQLKEISHPCWSRVRRQTCFPWAMSSFQFFQQSKRPKWRSSVQVRLNPWRLWSDLHSWQARQCRRCGRTGPSSIACASEQIPHRHRKHSKSALQGQESLRALQSCKHTAG